MSAPTLLDLFSGIGGLSLGFEAAGFQCLAGVEHNPQHRQAFAQVHPSADTSFCDVTTLTGKALRLAIGLGKGDLAVIVGGPPCQAFSLAGRRRGTLDDRGKLVHEFVRLISELRPRAFVMENVQGMASIHGGDLLDSVIKELSDLRYKVARAVLNAADYGVPQLRRRLFVVGIRGARFPFEFPEPTHARSASNMRHLLLKGYVSVGEALGDLPRNGDDPDDFFTDDDVPVTYAGPASNDYQRGRRGRLRKVTGNQGTVHQPHILRALEALGPGDEDPPTRYRRLYADRPSFTLRAGSGSFTALRPIHPSRDRVITVREAARLQSFPDRVAFARAKKWAYQQIGNSVPPLLGEAIANRLITFIS